MRTSERNAPILKTPGLANKAHIEERLLGADTFHDKIVLRETCDTKPKTKHGADRPCRSIADAGPPENTKSSANIDATQSEKPCAGSAALWLRETRRKNAELQDDNETLRRLIDKALDHRSAVINNTPLKITTETQRRELQRMQEEFRADREYLRARAAPCVSRPGTVASNPPFNLRSSPHEPEVVKLPSPRDSTLHCSGMSTEEEEEDDDSTSFVNDGSCRGSLNDEMFPSILKSAWQCSPASTACPSQCQTPELGSTTAS